MRHRKQLNRFAIAADIFSQRSFENTDLVVIDWDAALVVDLTGYVDDVLYALELANLQLEEFRVMDQRLDKYLDRAYDDLDRVYLGARDRFYLDQWRTSVEQRLAQLDKLYSVVHAEMNERRMLWLEIIIVVFFAIDLLILLRLGR